MNICILSYLHTSLQICRQLFLMEYVLIRAVGQIQIDNRQGMVYNNSKRPQSQNKQVGRKVSI